MTQQALGIVDLVGGNRGCCKTAQCRNVTCVLLEDGAKKSLRSLAIVRHEGDGRLINPLSMRIGEACPLEGNARVRILLEVDQYIAVGKPRVMVPRHFIKHATHFLACLCRTSIAPISTRQIHARVRKIGSAAKHTFERRNALGDFVLVQ